MCDYSLMGVPNPLATEGEDLLIPSPIAASAPISVSMRVDSAERTKPNTLCPCFSPPINGRPIAPVPPASRTLISNLLRDQGRQGIVSGIDDEYGEQLGRLS